MADRRDTDGLRVVLSAPQLAAVLARQSINQTEILSNRLWGGLQIVGGVMEMAGAAVLCVAPEPTMASKAGCIVFGVHGSDTVSAGWRQVWSGQDTITLTEQGMTKLAETMKVGPDMANSLGLSLDMIVPFGFAGSIKAARAARVTMGRINLEMHEAKASDARLGEHTIERHVGKSEAWLRDRLAREPKLEIASSFRNMNAAEWAISEVLQKHSARVSAWAQSTSGSNRLQLVGETGRNVGYGLIRETGKMIELSKSQVFLKKEFYNGMPYYIITAYLIK
ncbi:RNase A-like domain-containing protein [Burkholderia glumae]